VQREIGDRLARMLLGGEVEDGGTVLVDRGEEGLQLSAVAAPRAVAVSAGGQGEAQEE
jgi:ATP-dependent Clp protease ATP-binding subunit ClpB